MTLHPHAAGVGLPARDERLRLSTWGAVYKFVKVVEVLTYIGLQAFYEASCKYS